MEVTGEQSATIGRRLLSTGRRLGERSLFSALLLSSQVGSSLIAAAAAANSMNKRLSLD